MEQPQFFINGFGDRYLHEVNRGTFNRLGSGSVFRQHFGERLFLKDTLHIVVGTDSGLLLRHVLHSGIPEGSRYLFLELEPLLPVIEHELDGELPADGVHLAPPHALAELARDIRFTDYANIASIKLIESVGAQDAYLADYRQAVTDAKQQLNELLWAYNSQLSNPTFINAQLHNLIEQHVPASCLRNSFDGATAAVLGGGPSLDELIPWIREHQDDLVIIAASRICRRLREAGITPHIVVSIDPTELSFDISKEFLELDPRVVLVHANHVAFPLLAQWRGRSLYLDRRFPWAGKDDNDNLWAAGPTVGNTAFALARAMGFGTIVFAGIDLCHSVEGYTHARGSDEFEAGPKLGCSSMRVPTNSGRMAETTPDFYNAIKAFGTQARHAGQSGIRILNPAAGAAVIDSVEHTSVDGLATGIPHGCVFERLHRHIDGDSPPQRRQNFAAMQRELARAHGRLRRIINLTDEALSCNDGLFGRNGKTADFRHKKRMDKIERLLDGRLADLSTIVRMFSTRAMLHMPPTDREWTDDEIEQAGRTYYTAYRDNARQVLKLVEDAQARIEVARIEDDAAPDFERLFAQWDADRIPGRGAVWRHRHPDAAASLAPGIAAGFARLDADFHALLAHRDTSHLRKMREEASLGPVRAKLQLLRREGNIEELANMIRQLGKRSDAEARELAQLALGYHAELGGDQELAFEHFSRLIDMVREGLDPGDAETPNPRLEDALRHMVMIAMSARQHDRALLILETLAALSPVYAPQFAELLRLSGDPQGAVHVYTEYLQLAPGDLVTMLRLGKLYQTMGVADAAKTAYRYVLDKEPDNKSAQALLQQIETAA